MEKMTDAEWREFVMTGTRTGKLGVTRTDGRPHVTPIWFVLDGEDVVFNTHETGVKGKSLRRDPRAVLCVDDDTPPYSYVMIEGIASLSGDPGELRRWATEIGARYMGRERAREFGERNGVPGEWLVRLRVSGVVAYRGVAD